MWYQNTTSAAGTERQPTFRNHKMLVLLAIATRDALSFAEAEINLRLLTAWHERRHSREGASMGRASSATEVNICLLFHHMRLHAYL